MCLLETVDDKLRYFIIKHLRPINYVAKEGSRQNQESVNRLTQHSATDLGPSPFTLLVLT